MSLVRVKNKFQVVIPEGVRGQVGVKVGDLLEGKVEHGKITFIPKSVVDRVPQVVKDVRAASKRKGLDKISMEEIDAEIAAVRSQKKAPTNRRTS